MNLDAYPLLSSLTTEHGVPLTECEFVDIRPGTTRLYVKPSEYGAGHGFDFCAVEFVTCTADSDDVFDAPDCRVERIVRGIALFDGIRHMYWGEPECDGYMNYPHHLSVILEHLSRLVKAHCSMPLEEL